MSKDDLPPIEDIATLLQEQGVTLSRDDSIEGDNITTPNFEFWLNGEQNETYEDLEKLPNEIKDDISQIGADLQDQAATLSKDDFDMSEPPQPTPLPAETFEEVSIKLQESGTQHDSIESDNITNPNFEFWLNGGQNYTYEDLDKLPNETKDDISQIGADLQDQGVTLSKDDFDVPESPEEI